MKLEDQVTNLQNQVHFMQYRIAELEGQVHTLRHNDGLIKDVVHQHILKDNRTSGAPSDFRWTLTLQPKSETSSKPTLACRERLSITRAGSGTCSGEVNSPYQTASSELTVK